jgi:hypothetical protein
VAGPYKCYAGVGVTATWTYKASVAYSGVWDCNFSTFLNGEVTLDLDGSLVGSDSCGGLSETCLAVSSYIGPLGTYKATFVGFASAPPGYTWTDVTAPCFASPDEITLGCVKETAVTAG